MAPFSYANMARQNSPETVAREEAVAALNKDLEAQVSPEQPAPAVSSSWKFNPDGTQSRVNPSRGVTEFVQNEGGTVKSWSEEYTPPPVDDKKSYAEILLTDITNRTEMINRKLLAGDIPAAEAERAQVDKFISDNSATLHKFTRYTGRDPMTLAASQKAMDLVTGAWLPTEQRAFFDPRVNPAAVARDAAVMGLSPAAAQAVANARDGKGPDAVWDAETLNAAGPEVGSLVTKSATKQQAAQLAARAASEPTGGSVSDWVEYRDDARQKLGASLPADVLSDPNMSPSALVSTFRNAFDSNDRASGLAAIDAGVKAVAGAADMSPTDKANLFHSTVKAFTDTVKEAANTNDPVTVAQTAKIVSSLQSVIPAADFASRKPMVSEVVREVSGYRELAASGGVPMTTASASTVASALAKQKMGRSDMSTDENKAVSVINGMRQLTAGISLRDDPTLPRLDPATAKDSPTATPTIGHGLFQSAMQRAVSMAGVRALATGETLDASMDAVSAILGDFFMSTGGKDRIAADMAAKASLRILSRQKSFDVRNIAGEFAKYPDFVKQAQEQATAQAVAAPAKTTSKLEELQNSFPAESPAYALVRAVKSVPVNMSGDFEPGNPEMNALFKNLKGEGIGTWARALTGIGTKGGASSAALSVILNSEADQVFSDATIVKAAAAMAEQANTPGLKPITDAYGPEYMKAYTKTVITTLLQNVRDSLGDVSKLKGNTVADALGSSVDTLFGTSGRHSYIRSSVPDARLSATAGGFMMPVESTIPSGKEPPSEVTENVDLVDAAVYGFLGKALAAPGETSGLARRVPIASLLYGLPAEGVGYTGGIGLQALSAAGKAEFGAAAKGVSALSQAARTFGPAAPEFGAAANALWPRVLSYAPGIGNAAAAVVGTALKRAAIVGLGVAVVYDAISKKEVPINTDNVAARVKGYLRTQFKVGAPPEEARPAAASASDSVLTDSAKQAVQAGPKERPIFDFTDAALNPGALPDVIDVASNTTRFMDKPVMDQVVRKFLEEDAWKRYGSKGGLQGHYLTSVVSDAYAKYAPDKPWSSFLAEVDASAATAGKAQLADLLKYAADKKKAEAQAAAEGKNAASSESPLL